MTDYPSSPYVSPPFWSDAMQCYRVEYVDRIKSWFEDESGNKTLGWRSRSSSLFCMSLEDAQRLYQKARNIKSWESWIEIHSEAIEIARHRMDSGLLFRIMEGTREEFRNLRSN